MSARDEDQRALLRTVLSEAQLRAHGDLTQPAGSGAAEAKAAERSLVSLVELAEAKTALKVIGKGGGGGWSW